MMLDYEWGNPTAAAAAMLLFGEDISQVNDNSHEGHQQQQQHIFDHYGAHGLGMDFFQHPQHISAAAALFATSTASTTTCHQRYGLALPPAPARIGLNLGVRTYFSSASPEEEMMAGRVCRRRMRTARCQAECCGADLTHAKHYHRRHKVCEYHSKASVVITAGLSQRFCQQCSRFQLLSEFDQGKRSCRKRLADHNRRRRKSQDLSTSVEMIKSQKDNNYNNASITNGNNNNSPCSEKKLITMTKPDKFSLVTHVSSPPQLVQLKANIPTPAMGLGLGCGAFAASAGLSASSSTGTPPPQSVTFLSQLGEFRGYDNRFPSWDETEDGSSIRGLYQSK